MSLHRLRLSLWISVLRVGCDILIIVIIVIITFLVCELSSEACLIHVLMLLMINFLELKEMEQYLRKVLN